MPNYRGYTIQTDCYKNEAGWFPRYHLTNLITGEEGAIAPRCSYTTEEEAIRESLKLAVQAIRRQEVGF